MSPGLLCMLSKRGIYWMGELLEHILSTHANIWSFIIKTKMKTRFRGSWGFLGVLIPALGM
ncbi:unnamed protein product [Tuber aestivum]|uniref:Uncharacterized protein n=1 Tax=Tuber aestivum TaxID=59557 RepID=A0A292PU58_9PEZI|nr:unnamed protein product [Tuber aestivum]